MSDLHYLVLYKPYGMLSQFSDESGHAGLGQLGLDVPNDVYPVGRLDRDSEGLLVLTNDRSLNALMLDPDAGHARTYWVQVEGAPTEMALRAFNRPMELSIKGKRHLTAPAQAHLLPGVPEVPQRTPPVRFRKTVPDSWLELTITEGKNRQVRKMTAHVGFPTLRLIRVALGGLHWSHTGLQPGDSKAYSREQLLAAMGISGRASRPQRTRRWDD